jgi:hypothetical protein
VERYLQRWGGGTIDPAHVYADDGLRYQILARRLTVSPRLMVAFRDRNAPKTTVTAVRAGPHQPAIDTAYRFGGTDPAALPPVRGWQP